MEARSYNKGEYLETGRSPELFLLRSGSIEIVSKGRKVETLGLGGFFGEERILHTGAGLFEARATRRSKVFVIPGRDLEDIPAVQLKLLEALKKRTKLLKTRFGIEWSDDYSVRIQQIDAQHKTLFRIANDILNETESKSTITRIEKLLSELLKAAVSHFRDEEKLMRENAYPGYKVHSDAHVRILHELDLFLSRLKDEKRALLPELLEFLKGWLVRHTLTVDRKYMKFLHDKGIS